MIHLNSLGRRYYQEPLMNARDESSPPGTELMKKQRVLIHTERARFYQTN